MRVYNKQLAAAQPLNVNSKSEPALLKSIYMYTMAAVITGASIGSISLEVSNDPETNDTMPLGTPRPLPVNWVTLANSTFALPAAGPIIMWNVRETGYNYVRVSYTDTSGGASTATMQIIVNGKGT